MSNGYQVLTRLFEQVSPHFYAPQTLKALTPHSFTSDFIQKLQEDGLTLEILDTIPKKIPVFKYFDHVVIHGRFPKSQVDKVNGYRYGVHFKTDLLQLRYDQIDIQKKKELNEMLQFVSTHKKNIIVPALQTEDGSMSFQLAAISLAEVKQLYDRIDISLFYGRKEIFRLSHPSGELGTFHLLHITLGAMRLENLWPIFTNWTGLSEKQYNTLKKKVKEDQKKELEELRQQEEKKKKRSEDNYKKAVGQLKRLPPWLGILNNNIILVSGLKDEEASLFQFIKIQEGKEDNLTVYLQFRDQLSKFNREHYQRTTKIPLSKLNEIVDGDREWFVYKVGDCVQQTEVSKQPKATELKEEAQTVKFELFYYKEKSVALFGDTREYKDILREDPFNGVPNFGLIHPETNKKTFGWIFSNDEDTIEALEEKFSITIKPKRKNVA